MPEFVLCKDCKQSINKEVDEYVMIEKGSDRYPEILAHVACEQKRAADGTWARPVAEEVTMA